MQPVQETYGKAPRWFAATRPKPDKETTAQKSATCTEDVRAPSSSVPARAKPATTNAFRTATGFPPRLIIKSATHADNTATMAMPLKLKNE